jgi:hypothetical protein
VKFRLRQSLPRILCALAIIVMAISAEIVAQQQRPRLRPVRRDYLAGKFLVIPPDGRSVSAQVPRLIARLADHDLVLPPADLLGDVSHSGKPDQIVEWARRADYADVEGVVLSLEMLTQGGVKAAPIDETRLRSRLTVIDFIRDQRRALPIYAIVGENSAVASLAVELTANGKIDYLLVCRSELPASEGEPVNRGDAAKLTEQITRRGVSNRVTITATMDSASQLLIARLLNHRFGIAPKFWIGTSRSPQAAGLAPLLLSQIAAVDGVALPGTPDAASRADVVFLVNAPETEDEARSALLETAATAISRGFRVALADMVEDLDSRTALLGDLRKRKMVDQLVAYSGSIPPASACATVLAQASSRLMTMKFLRDDVDRLQRAERAQVELMLTRMLSDISFAGVVRPKLENLLRDQLKADPQNLGAARERAETFARDELTRIAEEGFKEQFSRNTHAIMLATGERAVFELRALQRVQLRFGFGTIDDLEVRAGVFLPLVNIAPRESGNDAFWELLEAQQLDDRIVRRFENITWPRFKVDVEQVAIQVNVNRREIPADGFSIQSRHKGTVSRRIEISTSSASGAFYALCRLEQMGAEGRLAQDFVLSEVPAVAVRGALEGAPGYPWSHRDRLDFVRAIGRSKLNRFFLAPSGEPILGEKWREPFSSNDLDRFRELLLAAKDNFVTVVFGLTLGNSFNFANEADYEALTGKVNALRGAGVRHILLNFNEADVTRGTVPDQLKALADSQAKLASRVIDYLRKPGENCDLYITPSGIADPAPRVSYLRELDATLAPDIVVVLAGGEDGAQATARETSGYREMTRRRAIVIDRFLANDGVEWRPFLGAKNGTSERLDDLGGVIGAALAQPHVSLIPLATLGDYLWDPRGYNPSRSLDVAIKVMFDDRSANGVRQWTNYYGGTRWQTHQLEPLFKKQSGDVDLAEMDRSLSNLEGALELMMMDRQTALTRAELGYFVRRSRIAMRRLMNDPSYERLPDAKYRLRSN